MSIATLSEVSKVYELTAEHKLWALQEIDLTIQEGEFIVILGPSGSGKTTLLNILGGIDSPTQGNIIVDEISLIGKVDLMKYRREKIGHIFQFFNLIPTLTAQENIEYVLEMVKGLSRKEIRQKACEYLEFVDLLDHADKFPSHCSGGEQQRIAIARAVAKEPPIILADEPTGELDFQTGKRILSLLLSQSEKNKRTVMVVTHNSEIARIADRVIRLGSGRIIADIDNRSSRVDVSEISW